MRANELMIGDWVNFLIEVEGGDTEHDPQTSVYTPDQVRQIRTWGLDAEVEGDDVLNDIDQLQPIPLTAEILEKNGWRKPQMDYDKEMRCEFLTCDGDWILWINGGSFMFTRKEDFVGHGIELKYVHELQHALRLCNIDKEIEL